MYDWKEFVKASHHALWGVEDTVLDEIAKRPGILRKQGVGWAVLLNQVF